MGGKDTDKKLQRELNEHHVSSIHIRLYNGPKLTSLNLTLSCNKT